MSCNLIFDCLVKHSVAIWHELKALPIKVCSHVTKFSLRDIHTDIFSYYGSFPPTETDSDLDSDSDSKPSRYIVLCTTFSTGTDSDSDPCMDSFLNGYCTHFRDRSPSQGAEPESISVGGNEPLENIISVRMGVSPTQPDKRTEIKSVYVF